MKIAGLTLKDFRSYESATISFDQPLSIIRGHNHSGKSSLAQAIQLSLTPRTDGTDPRGAGANSKIRNGAPKAFIDLTVSGKSGPVELKTTYGPNKAGRNQSIGGGEGVPAAFERFMDSNTERLSCVLDAEYFIDLKPEAQKAVLASLVLPASYEFKPEMVAMAEKHLGRFEWAKSPVAVIDQVYEVAYKTRTTAKAAVGAIYIPQRPAPPENSAEVVQERLTNLRAMAAKEAKKKPAGTVQIGKLEQQLETLRENLKRAEASVESAQVELQEVNAVLLEASALKRHEKIAAGRALFAQIEEKVNDTVREIEAQREAQGIYEDMRAEPCCPTCTQTITPEFIDKKIAFHKAEEATAVEQQISLLSEQKALGDIGGSEAIVRNNNAKAEEKKRIQSALSEKATFIAQATIEIDGVASQLEVAKTAAAVPVDNTLFDSLTADIAVWEAALSPAIQYESTLRQIEDSTARQAAQKLVVADLETLCAYFGKDGIKATLISDHIGAFTQTVNGVLRAWGYEAELVIEPYSFLVTGSKGQLPLKELSGSERLFFGVALQAAIAVHGKIRMILVDRADTLINGERKKLFACLKGMLDAGTLDQAIVMVSDDTATAPEKVPAGVAYYRVAEGKVARL